jgi:integrase
LGKRANGEHSIYQRADGQWCGAIVYTDPATGKRSRRVLYGRTRTEVRAKLKDAEERVEAGAPVRDSKATVAEWLAQWRATTLAASSRKITTKELYRTLCVHHLEQAPFGAIPLCRLRPFDIEALILSLDAKDLSDATVQRIFNVLRVALSGAVRDGLIAKNPASAVKQPSVTRREARHLSSEEVARLLEAAKCSRYHCLLTVIAATGLRRGEAAALRWKDLDLKNGRLTVRGTLSRVGSQLIVTEPKTAKSRRSLPLSPSVVSMLKAHKRHQAEERLAAGTFWTDSEFVFVTETGTMLEPGNILRAVRSAADAAGLSGVGVHTLRHSAATTWLESGVHLKAVSELLGHASIAITADIYGHLSDEAARGAMSALSDAIGI